MEIKRNDFWEQQAERSDDLFSRLVEEAHQEVQVFRQRRGLTPYQFRERKARSVDQIVEGIMADVEIEQTQAGPLPKGQCKNYPRCTNKRHAADCTGYCKECKEGGALKTAGVKRPARRDIERSQTPCACGCGGFLSVKEAKFGKKFVRGHKPKPAGRQALPTNHSTGMSAPRKVEVTETEEMNVDRLYANMLDALRADIAVTAAEVSRLEDLKLRLSRLQDAEAYLAILVEGAPETVEQEPPPEHPNCRCAISEPVLPPWAKSAEVPDGHTHHYEPESEQTEADKKDYSSET